MPCSFSGLCVGEPVSGFLAQRRVLLAAYLNEITAKPEVMIWPYKGLLLASPSRGTEFYFTCIFCPTARKRAIYVLLVANSFIKTSTCSSLRSMLKAKAFTECLHRQSRWFPYPTKESQNLWFWLSFPVYTYVTAQYNRY